MPHNAKAMNSLFTDLKNRTMEDITKELNSATQYLRVMKRTGNHKEDCDNVLMHLANIEDLVNKLFIANVSKSFTEKQMDDAYDKGYEDGATAENEMH
tara:strand:+ start:33 stop:326 length:294 start_codon:yes stop_codon:yes gene_type:complete